MTDRLAGHRRTAICVPSGLGDRICSGLADAVLCLAAAGHRQAGGGAFGFDLNLVGIAASLVALWIVLRISTLLLRDEALARMVATGAWIVAALDITGLLEPGHQHARQHRPEHRHGAAVAAARAQGGAADRALMWAALALARLIGGRMEHLAGVSPSVQALTRNLVTIALMSLALLIGLSTVGIDLTALTVFSGAVGVGLGFGLQKIVSNFVSGIILLIERSVRPGDVIEVARTYGLVTSVGARYASVRGRDGKEYLIPNETLITNQVVNWSVGNSALRLDLSFAVPTSADIHAVRRFAVEAAKETKRVARRAGAGLSYHRIRRQLDQPAAAVLDRRPGERRQERQGRRVSWRCGTRCASTASRLPNPTREILIREIAMPQMRARADPLGGGDSCVRAGRCAGAARCR